LKGLGSQAPNCQKCNTTSELIYMVQLLTQDQSTYLSDELFRILLYSYGGRGQEFFGGRVPANLYHDQEARRAVEAYLTLLGRHNVYVEGVIEKIQSKNGIYYQLVSTRCSLQLL
jgi:hypothetical protein